LHSFWWKVIFICLINHDVNLITWSKWSLPVFSGYILWGNTLSYINILFLMYFLICLKIGLMHPFLMDYKLLCLFWYFNFLRFDQQESLEAGSYVILTCPYHSFSISSLPGPRHFRFTFPFPNSSSGIRVSSHFSEDPNFF
jgi:hypothetical protein